MFNMHWIISLILVVGPTYASVKSGACPGPYISEKGETTLAECSELCKATNSCLGAVYKFSGKECSLKSNMDECHASAGSTATFRVNYDCFGNDIKIETANNLDDCVSKCKATNTCVGVQFNYFKKCIMKYATTACDVHYTYVGLMVWLQTPVVNRDHKSGYRCDGIVIGPETGRPFSECLNLCRSNSDCEGFNYDLTSRLCSLKSSLFSCGSVNETIVLVKPKHVCTGNQLNSNVTDMVECIEKCKSAPDCSGVSLNNGRLCRMMSRMENCQNGDNEDSAWVA